MNSHLSKFIPRCLNNLQNAHNKIQRTTSLQQRYTLNQFSKVNQSSSAQQNEDESLSDRMKIYEEPYNVRLPPNEPYVIRLDGHRFSVFVRDFEKPLDSRIHYAMLNTTIDMMKYFPSCTAAYTASDEISLIFPDIMLSGALDMAYKGRIMKIGTLAAGYCSVRFNHYLTHLLNEKTTPKIRTKIESSTAHFDARVYSLPEMSECVNNIIWRMVDCKRNSISRLGQHYFKHQVVQGKQAKTVVEMLKKQNVHWDSYPAWFRYGTLLKKKQTRRKAFNPKTGKEIETTRGVISWAPADILGFHCSASATELLALKTIPLDHPLYNQFEEYQKDVIDLEQE